MSDKRKKIAAEPPKTSMKAKRPSTLTSATTRKVKPTTAKALILRSNANPTVSEVGNVTNSNQQPSNSSDESNYREIAYGDFLKSMLEDCLVDEKIIQQETEAERQMTYLAERFRQSIEKLDSINKRLKEILFVVEQKRLLDLKTKDCTRYTDTMTAEIKNLLQDLNEREKTALDCLELKNVEFGYDNDSGHKQLLDALEDALNGLDLIKKNYDLDLDKLKAYQRTQISIEDIEKDRMCFEDLKKDFEKKFPNFSEKLLKVASEVVFKMVEKDDDDDDDSDSD